MESAAEILRLVFMCLLQATPPLVQRHFLKDFETLVQENNRKQQCLVNGKRPTAHVNAINAIIHCLLLKAMLNSIDSTVTLDLTDLNDSALKMLRVENIKNLGG
jgi:hypothetical protein